MNLANINKEYFEGLKEFAEESIQFITKLKKDNSFCNFLLQEKAIKELGFDKAEGAIDYLFLIDTARCFKLVSDVTNFESKEFFALFFLQAKLFGLNLDNYEQLVFLIESKNLEIFNRIKVLLENLKNEINKSQLEDYDFLKLAYILNYYDANFRQTYLKNIYHFTSIVIKADGTVSEYEEYVLKNIIKRKYDENISQRKYENNMEDNKVTNPILSLNIETQSLEDILTELNSLTGLSNVKNEISTLINFIKIQKTRESLGLKSSSISYHLVFTGNPGTGKTTVARIISKVYKCLGVLSQGQLVETDRSGLVAEYLGQTAIKVNKTVTSALNGVLFIDEAYSLAGKNNDSFGEEAIATLIKIMEDKRDKLVVIAAGYTNEMKNFINTNPGFQSRFNRYIEFPDYTTQELFLIFESQCTRLENNLTESAKVKVISLFEKAYKDRDKTFGNGRFVRNIFEKTLEKQANRIASISSINKEILTTITEEDIP